MINVLRANSNELAETGVNNAPLTSADAVEEAEEQGVVRFQDTGVIFTCPVRPHDPHHEGN